MLTSRLARKVRANPRLRPLGIAGYRLYTRLRPAGHGPTVLANSIPKAGTHVLMSLLDAVPGMRFAGTHLAYTGADRPGGSNEESLRDLQTLLRQLRPAHYMTGHIRHQPDIVAALDDAGCRVLLSIRDPHAIALSAANYLLANERHPLHERIRRDYPELDDRIHAVITGIPPAEGGPGIPGLAQRLDRYLPWLAEPGVCVVRYEDLAGAQGGGSAQQQMTAVEEILHFLGLPADEDMVARVAGSVYSTTSATFRRGQIDSWRQELAPHHIELIDELCKQQLVGLGYSSR